MQDKLIKKIILMVGIIAVLGVASSSVVISSSASAQTLAEKDSSSAKKIVVFIEVDNPKTKNQLKALPDVVLRHDFPNGFSATIPAPAREGIEKRPGVTVHDVPIHRLLVPSDQTPYGIEQIYNESTIPPATAGDGVVIGHLDSGVNKDHPDLKDRIVGCKDTTGRGIKNGCEDNNGHGTHTLGTAVADGGDGTGIFGVAPGAEAYVVKVCKRLCFTDDIAAAINFLGDKVQIITMSIGGDTESSLIRDAINRNLHILYVAAAGNDGPAEGSIDYPGANPNVIAVAAIDSTKTVASGSSRGIDDGNDSMISEKEVELSAAGVGVLSTWNDGGYNTISGTSMATPHIAGLAAKEWQGTADKTRAYLRTLVEDITSANGGGAGTGYDIASGYGLGHVTPAGPVNDAPTVSVSHSPTSPTSSDTVTYTATASDNVGVASIEIHVDGTLTKTCLDSTSCSYSEGPYAAGSTHNYYATASDAAENTARDPEAETKSFTVTDSTGTTVSVSSIVYATEGGKKEDKHLLITVSLLHDLSSVSGASVSITLNNINTGGSWSGTATTGGDGTVTFTLKNARSGCYTTTITDVTASGLEWDDATPANEFCK